MSGRVHREFRKQANQVANETMDALSAPMVTMARNIEYLKQERDRHETRLDQHDTEVQSLLGLAGRPFLGRLKWLLLGR